MMLHELCQCEVIVRLRILFFCEAEMKAFELWLKAPIRRLSLSHQTGKCFKVNGSERLSRPSS